MKTPTPIAPLLQSFLADYLVCKRGFSLNTVRSYRDALRQLLLFATRRHRSRCAQLAVEKIDVALVLDFLDHLERDRRNCPQTRNQRLAAIRSLFHFVATQEIALLDHCRKITSIPFKRTSLPPTRYLERDEVASLLGQFTTQRKASRRHYALLLFLYNTGARAQEAADLRLEGLELQAPYRARLCGKGNKWRVCPLWKSTALAIQESLAERGNPQPNEHVFANRKGQPLTRFGIYYLVRKYGENVKSSLPSLKPGHLSPHVIRHATAVNLLESGVEVNVIREWLGHAHLETTNRYAEINFRTKEKALQACEIEDKSSEGCRKRPKWRTDEALMKWLQSL